MILLTSGHLFSQDCNCNEKTIECEIIKYAQSADKLALDIYYEKAVQKNEKINKTLKDILEMWRHHTWENFKDVKKEVSKSKNACYMKILDQLKKIPECDKYLGFHLFNFGRKNEREQNYLKAEEEENQRAKQVYNKNIIEIKKNILDTIKETSIPITSPNSNTPISSNNPTSSTTAVTTSIQSKNTPPSKYNFHNEIVLVETVTFKEGEITLDLADNIVLEKIIATLNKTTNPIIQLEGFASNTGNRSNNMAISASRCYAVKEYFKSKGIKNEIQIQPIGETSKHDFRAVIITLVGQSQ